MIHSRFVVSGAVATLVAACPLILLKSVANAGNAEFTPLGFYDAFQPMSLAHGITPDGSRIVGTTGVYAGIWTFQSGWVVMDLLDNTVYCQGYGIANDGNTVVGNCIVPAPVTVATRWQAPDFTPEYVGPDTKDPWFHYNSRADALSGNGLVHVGQIRTGLGDAGAYHPGRWDPSAGDMVSLVGELEGDFTFGHAAAVSEDGSVVTGWYRQPGLASFNAYRWTQATGFTHLGALGTGNGQARGISPNGNIIVGDSSVLGIGRTAFMWRPSTGMVNKGNYISAGVPQSTVALAVNADGSRMVGYYMVLLGTWRHYAAIWDQKEDRWLDLQQYLADEHDIHLFGWTLSEATAIAPDGRFIVGHGVNPLGQTEGWLIELPAPPSGPTCPADLTGSGAVGVPDLLALLSAWGPCPASCPADLTGNGSVGVPDLLAILSAWGPCP